MIGERPRFVMASANPDKVAEIAAVLAEAGIVLEPRPADVAEVEETGETLEENARLKAVALAEATGLPAVKKLLTKPTASSSILRRSGLATPPGNTRASYSSASFARWASISRMSMSAGAWEWITTEAVPRRRRA